MRRDVAGATPGTPRPGFTNADLPYVLDFDTAPGFWLTGHPASGSATVRTLEGALSKVRSPNPYTGKTENLFRFLIDEPRMKALPMVTSDPDRAKPVPVSVSRNGASAAMRALGITRMK